MFEGSITFCEIIRKQSLGHGKLQDFILFSIASWYILLPREKKVRNIFTIALEAEATVLAARILTFSLEFSEILNNKRSKELGN